MGTHFALALRVPAYQQGRRTTAKKRSFRFGSKYFGLILVVLLAGSALAYLIEVNTFSTAGYAISRLQNQIQTLQTQNEQLEGQTAQLQSIQNVQQDPAVLNMVPVTQMTYVQAPTLSQR